ncbi:MAG: hypothetical protein IPK20_05015 [Betaproteobacteria bacterium]|nr:hypothetical protein [Betaproteobacteria bacterium]
MSIDEDIQWQDSRILSVRITPEKDRVEMRLLYPEDWQSDSYAERTVVFENAYGYKEFEGPFVGSPTILSANVVAKNDRWSQLRLKPTLVIGKYSVKAFTLRVDSFTKAETMSSQTPNPTVERTCARSRPAAQLSR